MLATQNSEQEARSNRLLNRGAETAVAEQVISGEFIVAAKTSEDAVERVVREHARLVYRVAYSVLRNPQDAEDIAQETFVRVLRWRKKLDAIRDVKTWLASIAWRMAIDRTRKKPQLMLGDAEIDELRAGSVAPDQAVLASEMSALLGRMIASLPDRLRDVITLSTLQELSPAEIGQVLGIPESAVRARQFRARQLLKEKMAALLEGKYEP